jgi:hypothetical protein
MIFALNICAGEIVSGKACYHFSDNESLNSAYDIALSMAKREALESYSIFIQSTSTVNNSVLKNELITTLSSGFLKNLQIIKKSNPNFEKREVCITIQAEIEPFELKKQIQGKINYYKRKNNNFSTGLPESNILKILKLKHTNDKLEVTALCKQSLSIESVTVITTWFDADGIPDESFTGGSQYKCEYIGQVSKRLISSPSPKQSDITMDFEIEFR